MYTLDTKIKDIEQHVYLGEYDTFGVYGKLHVERVYIDVLLNHTQRNRRGIRLFSRRYIFEDQFNPILKQMYYPGLSIEEMKHLGQNMCGVSIIVCDDDITISDIMQFLKSFYLKVKTTKYK